METIAIFMISLLAAVVSGKPQALSTPDNYVLTAISREGIVPDVVDTIPPSILKVKFGLTKSENQIVNLGNVISKNATRLPPSFMSFSNNPNKLYFLLMVDPDQPIRAFPIFGEMIHWMVANIRGQDINSGETLVEYKPPSPGVFTGLHRYVILIYEQPIKQKMAFQKSDCMGTSQFRFFRFYTKTFTKLYNLGEPIAANFFKEGHYEGDLPPPVFDSA